MASSTISDILDAPDYDTRVIEKEDGLGSLVDVVARVNNRPLGFLFAGEVNQDVRAGRLASRKTMASGNQDALPFVFGNNARHEGLAHKPATGEKLRQMEDVVLIVRNRFNHPGAAGIAKAKASQPTVILEIDRPSSPRLKPVIVDNQMRSARTLEVVKRRKEPGRCANLVVNAPCAADVSVEKLEHRDNLDLRLGQQERYLVAIGNANHIYTRHKTSRVDDKTRQTETNSLWYSCKTTASKFILET
jgi:hypothetical protein